MIVRKSMTYQAYVMTAEGLRDSKAWPDWMQDYFIFDTDKSISFMIKENGRYFLKGPHGVTNLAGGSVLVLRKEGLRVVYAYPPHIYERDFEEVTA